MHSSLELSWKLLITIPEGGPNFHSGTKLFNLYTGKTLLRNIGGITNYSFFPYTLEPTNVFYDALTKSKLENCFVGKKFPFQFRSEHTDSFETVRISFHLYGHNVVVCSARLNSFDIETKSVDLVTLQNLETHKRLYRFLRTICGLIESGDHKFSAFGQTPKIYPCTLVSTTENEKSVSDKNAVEILTHHVNVTPAIVDKVLKKNENHQLDSSNCILIDRQGVFSNVTNSAVAVGTANRKYESVRSMFELAAAMTKLLSLSQYGNLKEEEKTSIDELIRSPNLAFANSVTGLKTWELLLNEFQLAAIYEKFVLWPIDNSEQDDTVPSGWSDGKRWLMGIAGTLIVASIIGIVKMYWPIFE